MSQLSVEDLIAEGRSPRASIPFRAGSIFGVVLHVGFFALFYSQGVWEMAWFNVASILIFVGCYFVASTRWVSYGFLVAMLEVAVHQTLAVHYVGWDPGFQYYLLGSVPYPLLLSDFRISRIGIPVLLVVWFLALLLVYLGVPPPYELDPTLVAILNLVNMVGAFSLSWALTYFYERGVVMTEGALLEQRDRSEQLIRNVLPPEIVDRLRTRPGVIADAVEDASVLFADLVGFTPLSQSRSAADVVRILDAIVKSFDELATERGVEKIKTIGDAYMAAAGLPTHRKDHAVVIADLALAMRDRIGPLAEELGADLKMRIGIHTGPVIAGVIGRSKFAYDIWGDTVNTASRMESHGAPGRVHVSAATAEALGDAFVLEERGDIEVKGKGAMKTFWVEERAVPQ